MSDLVASLERAVVVRGGFPLLSGVDLQLAPATITVLTGANGAGKTTLLRLLGGLVAMTSGSGRVCGVDLARDDLRALRRKVGWLGHEPSFYDDLSVRENLTFAARALGRPLDELAPALERVGLSDRRDVSARRLSAGQRRRLGLAWLLVRRPDLWLLDEPYAALDVDGRHFLDELFADVVAAGASVVVSAHDTLGATSRDVTTVRLVGGRVETRA
ncbi:MAG: heme ABC exporter ATP-binding protein CcmA [Acidobacteriota bacterium]|nr:heme ABC exporter ATP-binding protein CcmA [Acidobacteriota bacterium]